MNSIEQRQHLRHAERRHSLECVVKALAFRKSLLRGPSKLENHLNYLAPACSRPELSEIAESFLPKSDAFPFSLGFRMNEEVGKSIETVRSTTARLEKSSDLQ